MAIYNLLHRTKTELEKAGRKAGIVERYCDNLAVRRKVPGIKLDLYGIFDIVAMKPGEGIIGVQVCRGGDFQAHYRKITEEKSDNALSWLSSNGKIEVWVWRKLLVKRGGKERRWYPRVVKIGYDDFKGRYIPQESFG